MPYATEVPESRSCISRRRRRSIRSASRASARPAHRRGALFASAVEDALAPLGVRVTQVPLSPNAIHRLIEQA